MIVTKRVKVEQDKGVDVICNRCGESQKVDVAPQHVEDGTRAEDWTPGLSYIRDTVKVDHGWGYYSKQDGTVVKFDLCERCVGEITATFKVPPEVSTYEGPFYECRVCGR